MDKEILRMQMLAGIITEGQYKNSTIFEVEPNVDPEAEKDAELGLKKALASLKLDIN